MNTLERQIVAALDQLHRDMAGNSLCRWEYTGSGGQDVYSCPHLSLNGREVIGLVEQMNHYKLKEE
jgi:hypothetical protein